MTLPFLQRQRRRISYTSNGIERYQHSPTSSYLDDEFDYEYDEDDDEERETQQVYDSVVKIHCTHSEPNYLMPWQRTQQTTSTSSGFLTSVPNLGGLRILTNAHSVEYSTIVRVQRRGDQIKFDATVEAVNNECDLALLRVDDPAFYLPPSDPLDPSAPVEDSITGLTFGPLPALRDLVRVLGYPTGGDSMSVTSGIVSRIERQEYAQAGAHLLAIQIDAAINAGNSGG